jgi:hypothetical protein
MPIQQTDQRLFKGTTLEIFAFAPPSFDGWTYAESTDDNSAYRWNSTTMTWEPIGAIPPASFTQFTGAGPFAMSSTPTNTIGVNPAGDAVLNLPSLATVTDGLRVAVEHNGASGTVVILSNGGDVVGNAAIWARLYIGGSIQLQATVATGRWETIGYDSRNGDADVVIVADSATGNDANPGTSALPVATIAVAVSLWPRTNSAKCRVNLIGAGPYTMPTNVRPTQPVGPNAQACAIVGDTQTVAGSGTVNTVTSGIIPTNILTPTVGGMTVNAFRGLQLKFTSGALNGQQRPIAKNDATTITAGFSIAGAVNGDTYQILAPTTVISNATTRWTGPGTFLFVQVNFTVFSAVTSVDGSIRLWFDSCEFSGSTRGFTVFPGAEIVADAVQQGATFDQTVAQITDIGVQTGRSAFFMKNAAIRAGAIILPGGTFRGNQRDDYP